MARQVPKSDPGSVASMTARQKVADSESSSHPKSNKKSSKVVEEEELSQSNNSTSGPHFLSSSSGSSGSSGSHSLKISTRKQRSYASWGLDLLHEWLIDPKRRILEFVGLLALGLGTVGTNIIWKVPYTEIDWKTYRFFREV